MTHSTKRHRQKTQEKALLSASISVFTPNMDTTRRKLVVNTNALPCCFSHSAGIAA